MRFYLLYRNHGLYDPVLDDTELVYVPITQDEWQASNPSEQSYNTIYSENQNYEQRNAANNKNITKFDKTQAKESLTTDFQEQINLKNELSQIGTECLPPQARFKLPISEEYDPEGKKMSKLRRLYEKVLNIDLRKVLEDMRFNENKTDREFKEEKEEVINKDFGAEEIRKQNEMIKKDFMYREENKENINTTKETAVKIVEKSINKALSSKTKQKHKLQIEKEIPQTESKKHKESKFEEIESKTNYFKDERKQDIKLSSVSNKKETKRVTFNVDEYKEEEIFYKEMESNETMNTETEARLTPEKRKLLIQQDIEEVIQPGTVRDRSELFRKNKIMNDVLKESNYKYEKPDIKEKEHIFSNTKQVKRIAQQKAYKIGAQTILNVQRANYTSFGRVLLKTFFSQFTKVIILLSKFMKLKPESYFKKEKEKYFEQRREDRDSSKMMNEGELIIKKKLSGAKIAQIEGMKPVELTDKMNIVILELQRKSGIEDELSQNEFDKTEYSETNFDKTEFDKAEFHKNEYYSKEYQRSSRPGSENKIEENFKDSSYQHNMDFDKKQRKSHTYETTKTQSMEIREIRSEKRYSEYKSTKKESSPCNEVRTYIRDADGNIIYIAIVEAHVYTNKDAIFEDYMRRMSESKQVIEKSEINKQSDLTESTDKVDVYVGFDDTRKLSLASTGMIPEEDYANVQEMENKKVNYIRCTTDLEHVAKKIAVQNITQIIEPLLRKEVDIYAGKYAHVEIEMPVKTIVEKTDVTTEQNQMYFQAQVFVSQKSYMSIEKPEKPAIEITEIYDEDVSGIVEELKVTEEQPQTAIEPPLKSIAETSEVLINEEHVEKIVIPEPKIVQPSPTIDTTAKSVAIISEVIVDEANLGVLDIQKATTKTSNTLLEKTSMSVAETITTTPEIGNKILNVTEMRRQSATIDITKNIATEVSQVSFEEPMNESIKIAETKRRQSQSLVEQKNLTIPETISTFVEEPLQENLKVPEIAEKLPQTLIERSVLTVPEAFAVVPEGPKDEYFEIPSIAAKQTKSFIEEPLLTVAQLLDTVTGGPEEGEFKVTETPKEQPNIDLNVLKPITTNVVFLEDQHDELQVPKIFDKLPQTSMETPVLTVPISFTILPGGPKDGNFEIEKTTNVEPTVDFELLKATTITFVAPEGPEQENLEIPEIVEKIPQIELESPHHILAEALTIIPDGPTEGNLIICNTSEEQITVNFNELHYVETTSISLGDTIEHNLSLPNIIEKQPKVEIQETKLNVAEILSIVPEEPKEQTFDVTKIKNHEARINIEELKAAETKMITYEERANEKLDLPEIVKKEPQTSIVRSPLPVAETITTSSIESAIEIDAQVIVEKSLRSIEKKVNVTLETVTPVSHTSVTSVEETSGLSEKLKLSSQSANITLVESSAAMIAETTAVTVAKEEAFRTFNLQSKVKIKEIPMREVQEVKIEDIELNYTVELPKDDEVNEVFAEVTLNKQKSPPVEVFAEYEINEKKTEVDSDIFESIKLLKKHIKEHKAMEESFSYTALISDFELEQRVEEELLQILQSSKLEDISYFTFPSPTLIPIIQEYLFRLRGPKLRTFKHVEDVFEEATLRLKSKFQTATVQNFDASLTLILQDIAVSQLHSEVIEVDVDSREYVSEKESSMQYFDSKKISRSVEASVQSSEMQSLHTEVAVASAATKQTIETGIDVSVLAIEEEPIVESRTRISTAQRKKKSTKAESSQAESKSAKIQISDASQSQVFENKSSLEAQSLNTSIEMSMEQNLSSMGMSEMQSEISSKSKHIKSNNSSSLSGAAYYADEGVALELSKSTSVSEPNHKLGLRTDLRATESEVITNGFSPSPPLTPPTPLTDEYVFKLEIPLPRITQYVERDCSYSPESVEDDIILKCGYIAHIITRIERIIYSPPLPTPLMSPERQIVPIYKKPGLKGGSKDYRTIKTSLFNYFC
ncbi:unnamed protein product [Euphydryas editha]|uniref:Uncharacterized protein n=1 Tax=Euphydryas editha TaxID=104508 RepID=A0AAU9TEB9_EUPED|nr:unnamed protein product [Euphydryas editha]